MKFESTTHNIQKKYCRVPVAYPHDCVADWELWLTATVHHHKKPYTLFTELPIDLNLFILFTEPQCHHLQNEDNISIFFIVLL